MGRGRGRPKKKVASPKVQPLVQKVIPEEKKQPDDDIGTKGDELSEDSVEEELISKTLVKTPILEMKVISTKAEVPPKKLWVNVISGNRVSRNGMEIELVAPSIIEGVIQVEIEETNVELEIK
ncbi:unnamed protein product [Lathyrus oleraceus]